jgi:hypothetical protein
MRFAVGMSGSRQMGRSSGLKGGRGFDVDRLWKIHVQDQTPVARLIQEAGGIDAFLMHEGYGSEFGLLNRARTLTLEAQQN